jgi:colanic acid/amylovoran biosynthesis glycosyltransferase
MKIAFIVNQFPVLSETFILNQITGLIDRGHEVDIFAESKQKESKTHSDIAKYDLLSRTYYRHMPANKVWRVVKAIGLIISNFYKNPIVILKSLNPFKYGKKALSLELLYATIPVLGKGS